MNLQGSYNPNQTKNANYYCPFDVAKCVTIKGRFADFSSKLGVGVIKLLLYLMKDALFVVRERHEIFRSSVLPV